MSDWGEGFSVAGTPYDAIVFADSPFRADRSSLNHYQTGTAHGTAAKVDKMPIVGNTIMTGVLTHGRNG